MYVYTIYESRVLTRFDIDCQRRIHGADINLELSFYRPTGIFVGPIFRLLRGASLPIRTSVLRQVPSRKSLSRVDSTENTRDTMNSIRPPIRRTNLPSRRPSPGAHSSISIISYPSALQDNVYITKV